VVIGVPVCNAERFLEPTLRCLLAQDHPDLEIVVSDDASTDRTWEIAQQVAGDDSRFRFVRRQTRAGWIAHYNSLLRYNLGDYFAWVPHDDLYDASYVSTLVGLLERSRDAVLAYSAVIRRDEDRATVEPWPGAAHMAIAATPLARAIRYVWWTEWEKALPFRGIVRADALRATAGLREVRYAADDVWLLHLTLLGRFAHEPRALCQKRLYAGSTGSYHGRAPDEWPEYFAACRAVARSSGLSERDKRRLTAHIRLRALATEAVGRCGGTRLRAAVARRGPTHLLRLLRSRLAKLGGR
jgi:glycosyltransferase involved in cell wall biosynthesis